MSKHEKAENFQELQMCVCVGGHAREHGCVQVGNMNHRNVLSRNRYNHLKN